MKERYQAARRAQNAIRQTETNGHPRPLSLRASEGRVRTAYPTLCNSTYFGHRPKGDAHTEAVNV
jgi:hypothetical protein